MIGERIKKFREKMNLTQDELAKSVHLSQQTIDHYEKGRAKPNVDTIILLTKLFNTTSDYLLGISEVPEKPNTHPYHISLDQIRIAAHDEGSDPEEPSEGLKKLIREIIFEVRKEREEDNHKKK